jgi:hypothetical protein
VVAVVVVRSTLPWLLVATVVVCWLATLPVRLLALAMGRSGVSLHAYVLWADKCVQNLVDRAVPGAEAPGPFPPRPRAGDDGTLNCTDLLP